MLGNRVAEGEAWNAGLNYAEQMLVWTWRRLAAGRSDCPAIAWEFSRRCGDDAAEVLATFCTFLTALAYVGRRRLQVGYPGYPGLTGDERQCLILIAAAQANDTARFEAYLRWLARTEFRPALAIAARARNCAQAARSLSAQR